jgi:hypothetical protein
MMRIHSCIGRLSVALEPATAPWMANLARRFADVDVIGTLHQEVAETGAEKVVLSTESLSFLREPTLLRAALGSAPANVIVYLRRQDDFLSSFYNQLVKSRLLRTSFADCIEQVRQNNSIDVGEFIMPLEVCHFDRLLERWTAAFGKESVFPRVYEDYTLPHGIIEDFAHHVGFSSQGLSFPLEDTNPRLGYTAVALKRRVNGLLLGEEERIASEDAFTGDAAPRSGAAVPQDKAATVQRRRGILEMYRPGNEIVATTYFGGRKLFREPSEADPPLTDAAEGDWQDTNAEREAVKMIAMMIRGDARRRCRTQN